MENNPTPNEIKKDCERKAKKVVEGALYDIAGLPLFIEKEDIDHCTEKVAELLLSESLIVQKREEYFERIVKTELHGDISESCHSDKCKCRLCEIDNRQKQIDELKRVGQSESMLDPVETIIGLEAKIDELKKENERLECLLRLGKQQD